MADLPQHRAKAAGREEILHVIGTGRFQIDEHRRGIAELVQPVERDADAAPSGDRRQVHDRVG